MLRLLNVSSELMKELFEWLNEIEEHPLIKSSIFHYEFEFIHPFSDGNGRTGRFWQMLILSNWRPVFKNLPVENIVYTYRKEYYKAIAISGGEDGCTPFIEFILGIINETLDLESNAPRSTPDKFIGQIHNNPKITRNALAAILGITSDGGQISSSENDSRRCYYSAWFNQKWLLGSGKELIL